MSQPRLDPPAVFRPGDMDHSFSGDATPQTPSEKSDIEAQPEGKDASDAASLSIEQGLGVTKIEALCEPLLLIAELADWKQTSCSGGDRRCGCYGGPSRSSATCTR